MTENEAIEVLNNFDMQVSAKADGVYQSTIGEMACMVAVKALSEIQQYRAIGTFEECREARERQIGKKPEMRFYKYHTMASEMEFKEAEYYCPECGGKLLYGHCQIYISGGKSRYCPHCGQTIDWSK